MRDALHPSHDGPPEAIGLVVGGSLSRGLQVRLDGVGVEEVKVGRLIAIEGHRLRFFGTITDVELQSTDARLAGRPEIGDPFIARSLSETAAYGSIRVLPSLAWDPTRPDERPEPAKTVPPHFARARNANQADIALVFGDDPRTHFYIGTPLEMETRLHLDLPLLAQRSIGIFGKTGTGKTFLARLLLIGLLQKGNVTHLIFDAHNDYGWEATSESASGRTKGLKQLFNDQVAVFTLDEASSYRRHISPDFVVSIGYDEIEPEDVALLQEELGLQDAGVQATYTLHRHFGRSWLREFLQAQSRNERQELAKELGEHTGTLEALARRLRVLERFPFLKPEGSSTTVETLLAYLDRGKHVVLEFGRYGNETAAYILVANFLTRRIHERYVQRTEAYLAGAGERPRHLLITLEEAHRFLSPAVASHTIFGTIAREMRKYHVTLLVIDQRPSGIDEEVLSQLGTRFCLALDNEKDREAALAGAPNRSDLRAVLDRLEPKQQVLALGHALPLPVVLRVRDYDEAFFNEIAPPGVVRGMPQEDLERALGWRE